MDVTDAHAEGQRELCMPNLATNSASNGGKLASNCIALAFNKHPIASNALATNTKSASNGGKLASNCIALAINKLPIASNALASNALASN